MTRETTIPVRTARSLARIHTDTFREPTECQLALFLRYCIFKMPSDKNQFFLMDTTKYKSFPIAYTIYTTVLTQQAPLAGTNRDSVRQLTCPQNV
jgi:hypothetical protein